MSFNQDKINQIGQLALLLVKKFIDHNNNNKQLQITKYILRIIGSNVSSLMQDEYTLILAIKNFLSKKGSTEELNEFDKLYNKLSNMNNNIKLIGNETNHSNVRFSILLLLYQLRQKEVIEHSNFSSLFLHSKEDKRINQLFEGLTNLETPSISKEMKSTFPTQLSDEDKLINDLLFIIQGIDGEYIKYNPENDDYDIKGLEVKRSQRILIRRICELGWVFNRIKSYLSNQFNESEQVGLIEQSFKENISNEIKNYYKMIVLLETKLKENYNSSQKLTLRKFLIWTMEPLKRLKWIAAMLEHSDFPNKKNLDVVVRFHHLSLIKRNGDPKMRLLTSKIEENSSLPLISMLKSWIFQGELVDPYSEFFIVEQKSPNVHWERRFLIDGRKLPSHISLQFARLALEVGKTIVYLKEYLHDYDWLIEISNSVYTMNKESLETISQLKIPMEQLNRKLNNRLLHLLLDKYEFIAHCEAQKQYIYLEQSDFVNAFINHSSKMLDRLSDKLYVHNIMSAVDMAIKASSASSWPTKVQEFCDVKLNNVDSTKKGWEVVELTYKSIPELSVIFDFKDNLEIQGLIFKFQWKIKRSLYLLSKIWKYLKKYRRTKSDHIKLHQFQILLNNLYINISNIEYHIIFDVIETAWSSFLKGISRSNSLRQIIFEYRKYVLKIYESISRKYDLLEKQTSLMDISVLYANVIEDFKNIVKKCIKDNIDSINDHISIQERNKLIQQEYMLLHSEIMKRMNDS